MGEQVLAADLNAVLALEPKQVVAVLLRVLIEYLGLVVGFADCRRRQGQNDGVVRIVRKVLKLEVVEACMNIVDKVVAEVVVPIKDIACTCNTR